MSTLLDTPLRTEIDPTTGGPRSSHIVKQSADKTADEMVTESRFNGTELEALCGHRFVATRDAKAYPVCQKCLEVYHSKVPFDGGMPTSDA